MDDAMAPNQAPGFLKVLASGSGGNCSVLLPQGDRSGYFWLIDAGLSPRRTRKLLHEASLSLDQLAGVLVTHLDSDHWNVSWKTGFPAGVRVLLHARHADPARRAGLVRDNVDTFDGPLDLRPGVRAFPTIAAHDELGSAAFRFEFGGPSRCATLGYATDVGRVSDGLVEHLRGVDVLAIESNYCSCLQDASGRPWFLRQRITGGQGHLSNQQCAAAVAAIRPRHHVVLLHLSRQCNRPDLALREHPGAGYELTIAGQHEPTPWIPIVGRRRARPIPVVHAPLFESQMRASPVDTAD